MPRAVLKSRSKKTGMPVRNAAKISGSSSAQGPAPSGFFEATFEQRKAQDTVKIGMKKSMDLMLLHGHTALHDELTNSSINKHHKDTFTKALVADNVTPSNPMDRISRLNSQVDVQKALQAAYVPGLPADKMMLGNIVRNQPPQPLPKHRAEPFLFPNQNPPSVVGSHEQGLDRNTGDVFKFLRAN